MAADEDKMPAFMSYLHIFSGKRAYLIHFLCYPIQTQMNQVILELFFISKKLKDNQETFAKDFRKSQIFQNTFVSHINYLHARHTREPLEAPASRSVAKGFE